MKDRKTNSNIISDELLFRHFACELSPDEDQQVLEWKNSSLKNRDEYDRFLVFYRDFTAIQATVKHEKRYNSEVAWDNFKPKFEPPQESSNFIRFIQLAASVVIVMGIGWWSFNYLQPEYRQLTSEHGIVMQQLTDNSTVTLNLGSELTYPEKFSGKERRVALKGEAYFEIQKDPEKPFIIEAANAQIEVLGTSFNVLETEDLISVVVDEGLVKMSHQKNEIFLKAGTRGVLNNHSGTLEKIDEVQMGTEQFWKTRALHFRNHKLHVIAKALELAYDIEIVFVNESLKECTLTVEFVKEEIEQVMKIISTTLNIDIKNRQTKFYINGDSCKL